MYRLVQAGFGNQRAICLELKGSYICLPKTTWTIILINLTRITMSIGDAVVMTIDPTTGKRNMRARHLRPSIDR
jgi:hypothetical protein